MRFWDSHIAGLIVAVAVGLLIGVDRERHKHAEPDSVTAGVRTFTLTSLLGAIAALAQSDLMLAVVGVGVVVLIALSYLRGQAFHRRMSKIATRTARSPTADVNCGAP